MSWLLFVTMTMTMTLPTVADALSLNHDDLPPNWISGVINTDLTLTRSFPGPDYILYGDIHVPAGVSLIVESGVTLSVVPNSDFLSGAPNPGKVDVLIDGTLRMIGVSGDRISARSSGTGTWGGIVVQPNATAHFKYCDLSDAQVILTGSQDSWVTLERSTLTNCETAIFLQGDTRLDLAHSTLFATYGLRGTLRRGSLRTLTAVSPGGGVGIESLYPNVVVESPDSIYVTPGRLSGYTVGIEFLNTELKNVIIDHNGTGINSVGTSGSINYCTIADNGMTYFGGQTVRNTIVLNGPIACPTFYYSAVWSSTAHCVQGVNVAYYDPQLDANYRMAPTSMFIDYSVSGGQIGAFGPGGTPVLSVQDQSSDGMALVVMGRELEIVIPDDAGYLEIYDIAGRRALPRVRVINKQRVALSMEPGVYWARLNTESRTYAKKLLLTTR